tara:strand:+ start:21 stop:752 length:732 start_codon:yes stop_codon:yes gene_type:complete
MQRPIHTYTDNYGQTIEFTIPDPHTKICVNVSGGADSAILLYMLIKYCEEHIPEAELHLITSANPVKSWKNAKWSTTVIDQLLHLTNTTLIKSHYTFYSDDQRRTELDDVEKMVQEQHGITFTIHGTNQNPPLAIEELLDGRHLPRDAGHGRHLLVNTDSNIMRYMPLMNVDKRMVAHLYKYFDMLEELFPYTRSCEWNTLAFPSANPGDGHCGECWWCKEREWAFGFTTLSDSVKIKFEDGI